VTLVAVGVLMLVIFFLNQRFMRRPSIEQALTYPLVRRMNAGIAVSGAALIALGLFFPKI
jgi:hypothetical protein